MKKLLLLLGIIVCSVTVSSAKFKLKPFEPTIKYRGEVSIGGAFCTGFNVNALFLNKKIKSTLSRPYIETVHGVMISEYIFAGAGIGLQYFAGDLGEAGEYIPNEVSNATSYGTLTIPIFLNIKGFLPLEKSWKPYVNLCLGGTVVACSNLRRTQTNSWGVDSEDLKGGFYCDFGAGIEYKKWIFGIGLQHQVFERTTTESTFDYKVPINSFYVKVGIAF